MMGMIKRCGSSRGEAQRIRKARAIGSAHAACNKYAKPTGGTSCGRLTIPAVGPIGTAWAVGIACALLLALSPFVRDSLAQDPWAQDPRAQGSGVGEPSAQNAYVSQGAYVSPKEAIVASTRQHADTTAAVQPLAAPRSSRVETVNGRPTIFVNGAPYAPLFYALTDVPGGRWSWEELPQHNIRLFCNQGIRLYQVDLFLEQMWMSDGTLDIGIARKQLAGVQAACPGAHVFVRLHLRAPQWWLREHPDEWVAYADTTYVPEQEYGLLRIIEDDNNPVRRVSMASERWRDETTVVLRRVLRALAGAPEGDGLAGIQVANGVYGEWHNWGFYRNEPDVSAPMQRAYRSWLRDRYGTAAALQAAWNNPTATFETAPLPGMDARRTPGVIRDPEAEQPVADYYASMHHVVADNILHFANVVKATWPRPLIVGTFYGYYFSTFGRQAAGGHLQLQRILRSDAIDYLSGPQAYEPEAIELGDPYRSRSLITSVRLHGKLWLDEMDAEPTIPTLRDERYDRLLRASIANVRRNVTFSLTKGMGLWFYDFGVAGVDLDGFTYKHKGSQGNWDHPAVMAEIGAMKQLLEAKMQAPYASEADVLFVYDTESLYYTASVLGGDPVSPTLIDYNTLAAFRSGVIFDPIHLDDLERVDLTPYRTVVFGNTYLMTPEERAYIRDQVATGGRHLVWFHAPGYLDQTDAGAYTRTVTNEQAMERLIQMDLAPVAPGGVPSIDLIVGEEPGANQGEARVDQIETNVDPGNKPDMRYTLGTEPLTPLFTVTSADAQVIGQYASTGQPAIARRTHVDHTSWYVGLPSQDVQPLAYILQESGAHRYNTDGDIFYGGGGLLVMHTLEGGTRAVTLRNGQQVTLRLPEGPATVILDPATGAVLQEAPDAPEGVITPYD